MQLLLVGLTLGKEKGEKIEGSLLAHSTHVTLCSCFVTVPDSSPLPVLSQLMIFDNPKPLMSC